MSADSKSSSAGAARVAPPTDAALAEAARIILSGGLVAMPTETVYGLAADATNPAAVAAIYAAKERPSFNPLICHVASMEMARGLAEFSPLAEQLAARFWPGPLTLVLPKTKTCPVADLATAGLDTVALRMPKNPTAIALIARVGRPLAAPSANPSERLSPTTAAHVAEGLGAKAGLILDGGACPAGVESSIVMVGAEQCFLLRPGALARAEIESVTGPLLAPDPAAGVVAPGMMRRHYAPRARVRIGAVNKAPGESFLGFGPPPEGVVADMNLSLRSDLVEAAANLFAMLRELDAKSAVIAIAPIPDDGLGEAINDRIKRAGAVFSKDSV